MLQGSVAKDSGRQMDMLRLGQTDGQTESRTDRLTNSDRPIDRLRLGQTNGRTGAWTDGWTDLRLEQTDGKTWDLDRQMDRLETRTDRWTDSDLD